jgi:hypothetical protein
VTARHCFLRLRVPRRLRRSVTERNHTAMHSIAVCDCTFRDDFVARLPSAITPQCTALLSAIAHSETTSSLGYRAQSHRNAQHCCLRLHIPRRLCRSVTERNRTAMHSIAVCDCTFRDDFVARLPSAIASQCTALLSAIAHSETTSSLGYRAQSHRNAQHCCLRLHIPRRLRRSVGRRRCQASEKMSP